MNEAVTYPQIMPGELTINGVTYIRDPRCESDAPVNDLADDLVTGGGHLPIVMQVGDGCRIEANSRLSIQACIRHAIREAVRRGIYKARCESDLLLHIDAQKVTDAILSQVKG